MERVRQRSFFGLGGSCAFERICFLVDLCQAADWYRQWDLLKANLRSIFGIFLGFGAFGAVFGFGGLFCFSSAVGSLFVFGEPALDSFSGRRLGACLSSSVGEGVGRALFLRRLSASIGGGFWFFAMVAKAIIRAALVFEMAFGRYRCRIVWVADGRLNCRLRWKAGLIPAVPLRWNWRSACAQPTFGSRHYRGCHADGNLDGIIRGLSAQRTLGSAICRMLTE